MELAGQVAIVTGAGRNIGRAIALELAGMGADIVVAEVDEATGRRTAAFDTPAPPCGLRGERRRPIVGFTPPEGDRCMHRLPGKFVWFEHVSNDIPAARAFYDPLFRWHTESMPVGSQRYPMIMNGDHGIGAYRALVEENLDGHMVSVVGQLDLSYVAFKDLINAQSMKTEVRLIKPGSDYHRLARFLETRTDKIVDWQPGRRTEEK